MQTRALASIPFASAGPASVLFVAPECASVTASPRGGTALARDPGASAAAIARSVEECYGRSMQRSAGEIRARRRTRRVVMAAYYAVVATFIVIAVTNITWQIGSPRWRRHAPADCGAGLDALRQGVERARQAAGELSAAGEDVALARFRQALLPEWDRRDEVAAACESNADLARALDLIERLRYAEERAVRREVSELSPLRRRVEQLRTSPPHP